MIGADRQPGILARVLGSMLQTAREVTEMNYDEAAARLGRDPDWLIQAETGFTAVTEEDAARILTEYGMRAAVVADTIIDLARRATSPPPWLAPHQARLDAEHRDIILLEAEATRIRTYGGLLLPPLLQTETYCRELAPVLHPGCDIDAEWSLTSARQAYQPAGVTRMLDVIIDEIGLDRLPATPRTMTGQLRYLLDLAAAPHCTIRVLPSSVPFWEKRGYNYDILGFAGSSDIAGVCYTAIGAMLASSDLNKPWDFAASQAVSPGESRMILQRHLEALS